MEIMIFERLIFQSPLAPPSYSMTLNAHFIQAWFSILRRQVKFMQANIAVAQYAQDIHILKETHLLVHPDGMIWLQATATSLTRSYWAEGFLVPFQSQATLAFSVSDFGLALSNHVLWEKWTVEKTNTLLDHIISSITFCNYFQLKYSSYFILWIYSWFVLFPPISVKTHNLCPFLGTRKGVCNYSEIPWFCKYDLQASARLGLAWRLLTF